MLQAGRVPRLILAKIAADEAVAISTTAVETSPTNVVLIPNCSGAVLMARSVMKRTAVKISLLV